MENPLRITSLNHVSIVCRSVKKSLDFYQNLLGFIPIRRPGSFDFDGAWLFNYGMGIHLLQSEDPDSMTPISEINPKDNHISFQCESVANVEKKLKEMKIKYVKGRVTEGGIAVDQLFFHDPDGLMIEICDCDNLPVIPLVGETIRSCPSISCAMQQQQQEDEITPCPMNYQKYASEANPKFQPEHAVRSKCSVSLPLPSLLMLLDTYFLP